MTKNDKNLNNSILSIVSVTQISPIATGTAGGAKITITGSGFQEGAVAYFGSQISKESILESETSLRVVVPMTEESGSVPVTVVNPDGGQFTLEGAFTYINSENGDNAQVFGVSPLVIIEEANTEITLRGRNLIIAYKDGLVALRCPSRVNIEISSVVQNEADENGIESLVFKATVTATPPLLPLERIAIQILASRRPKARDDLMVESSTQMFTVIPRDIPVPLAFTPSLSSDNPTMVVVLGENLEGCTLEFDSGTQTHVQMCDSHSLMGITTVTENMASGQSTMVSVLDKNGASVGQYCLSIAPSSELKKSDPIPPNDNSLFSGEGGIIETMPPPPANFTLDIVPIPNQKVLGPTEKDNLIFDLRGESKTNAVANAFNYTIQVYSYTIHFRIINRVYLFPLFDGGGSEFNSPILAKVGELFPVRGAGILVAFRLDIYLTVTVYIIIGINFDIPWFGYFNEFPQQFPNAIGIVIVGVRIEIDIYILASFMAALVLPDGRLQIIFLVVLIADFHFTISSDLHRLSFLPHFTHEVHHAGIFSGNNPLPCGGRFQLADDNGQTMFQDAHGGHLSYYFARSTGECCMPWRFNLELLQISSTNEEIVVQPPFDVNLCLNALESGEQIKVVIESVPPPTGNPETLVMNIADTAVLRALSVPVDQNGNPTGPGQDITELGYGVEFYLDQPLEVLSQGQLPDGVAIAIQEGSNIIRAAVTSVRVLDEEPALSFWHGSILGFNILRFLAEGLPPRIKTGGLSVTVNRIISDIEVTLSLAYKDGTQVKPVTDIYRDEPDAPNPREYFLAAKFRFPPGTPSSLKVKIKVESSKMLINNMPNVAPFPPNTTFGSSFNRAGGTNIGQFFKGELLRANFEAELTLSTLPVQDKYVIFDTANILPNRKETFAGGSIVDYVPPGSKVTAHLVNMCNTTARNSENEPTCSREFSVELKLMNLEIKDTSNNNILPSSLGTPRIQPKVINEETFEEYFRVFHEVRTLMTDGVGRNGTNDLGSFTKELIMSLPSSGAISGLKQKGENLWQLGYNYVQGSSGKKDDRMLYFSRLEAMAVLRDIQNRGLIKLTKEQLRIFEYSSRGLETIDGTDAEIKFSNTNTKKVVVTGFDPFLLPDEGLVSNPSGIVALSFYNNSTEFTTAEIRTAIFPVRFEDFGNSGKGLIEKVMEKAVNTASLIMTCSRGLYTYNVDRFATRYRTDAVDDNLRLKSATNNPTENTGNPSTFYIESTLPYTSVISVDKKQLLDGPSGSNNTPFWMNQSYTDETGKSRPYPTSFNDAFSYTKYTNANDLPTVNKEVPIGSGQNYLSNEIFYRTAKVRKNNRNDLPTGHLHLPIIDFSSIANVRTEGGRVVNAVSIILKEFMNYALEIVFTDTQINSAGSVKTVTLKNLIPPNITTVPAIEITSVEFSSPNFQAVTLLPYPIPPGGTKDIEIKFVPTEARDYTGILKLKDSNQNVVFTVSLKGKGTRPPLPTITDFTPFSGRVGNKVTINGTNFFNVTNVSIGDPVTFTVISPTKIEARVTPNASTSVIEVETSAGTVESTTEFEVIGRPPRDE